MEAHVWEALSLLRTSAAGGLISTSRWWGGPRRLACEEIDAAERAETCVGSRATPLRAQRSDWPCRGGSHGYWGRMSALAPRGVRLPGTEGARSECRTVQTQFGESAYATRRISAARPSGKGSPGMSPKVWGGHGRGASVPCSAEARAVIRPGFAAYVRRPSLRKRAVLHRQRSAGRSRQRRPPALKCLQGGSRPGRAPCRWRCSRGRYR